MSTIQQVKKPLKQREIEAKARTVMTQARLSMLLGASPFYGSLAMRLKFTPRENQRAPLSTNGRDLFYKPSVIADWPQPVVEAGVAHEVGHCANLHPFRQDSREHELWNIACDHVVNLGLKASGYTIPKEWLADPRFAGQAAETVYATLQREQPPAPPQEGDDQKKDGGGTGGQDESNASPEGSTPDDEPEIDPDAPDGEPEPQEDAPAGQNEPESDDQEDPAGSCDPSRPGDVEPPPSSSGEASRQNVDPADLEAQWQAAVAAAADTMGDLPADIKRLVEASQRSRVDWKAESRAWLQEKAAADYTWRRPSRRHIGRGCYLPSISQERLGMLVFVRDTSGSMGSKEIAEANAEIEAIVAEIKPRRFVVMDVDAAVCNVHDIGDGDPLPDLTQAHGGGGTNFEPPFTWVEENAGEDSAALIYFSDLAGRFPAVEPEYPTLWIATTQRTAPFGKTVNFNGINA